MKKIIDQLTAEMEAAFEAAGYDRSYGVISLSKRPDLCEYQCNGAMPARARYGGAPITIAENVAAKLQDSEILESAEAVKPGFINLKLSENYIAEYLSQMSDDPELAVEKAAKPETIVIDYGGPNVAKPLHVGHLRSAIIGESVKRMGRRMGNKVIGDIHMGDWGLQMGLIIALMSERKPELPYFDPDYTGAYPAEAPFTISELEEIYPAASARSKEDEEFHKKALQCTHDLQEKRRGYYALWQKIMEISTADLKKNYAKLNVSFELWKAESDAQPYIPGMLKKIADQGLSYEDQGAVIVDVKEESDTKEIPPCILLKSDGASLYTTTDLATIVDRMESIHPDEILYVVDKRQELHFIQVFRTARKAGLVDADTQLTFLGFGTMNGRDGKPFKTREGGVMRLENLIKEINDEMYRKIVENKSVKDTEDARKTAEIVGLSAIKYGDLSNQASKDYIFDVDRFTSFEGNTGPYILYTIVRIKSILARFTEEGGTVGQTILAAQSPEEKDLQLMLARYNGAMEGAWAERAPHKICAYIYELSNDFNRFYHETHILTEEDQEKKNSWIALLDLTRKVLEDAIDVLGFSSPDRM
ncbi:MAG: arginine--tRNA ligase [Eubacterium sp.]|nr:arginine--tRNA ligase [Eubacterium sp.]